MALSITAANFLIQRQLCLNSGAISSLESFPGKHLVSWKNSSALKKPVRFTRLLQYLLLSAFAIWNALLKYNPHPFCQNGTLKFRLERMLSVLYTAIWEDMDRYRISFSRVWLITHLKRWLSTAMWLHALPILLIYPHLAIRPKSLGQPKSTGWLLMMLKQSCLFAAKCLTDRIRIKQQPKPCLAGSSLKTRCFW